MAYTNIDDPSAYFQTKLYVGTSGLNIPVTHTNDGNSDLQPDLIWGKDRSTAYGHYLCDSSRGRSKYLYSETTGAEVTTDAAGNDIVSFDTNGFKVGAPSAAISTNAGNGNKVAWQWKANGGTTSSNTDGNITSTVQADTTAGFSIVTYTGTGSATTLGHGLGQLPAMIIFKNRSSTADWMVFHKNSQSSYNFSATAFLTLNTTAAVNGTGVSGVMNNTVPTTSLFTVGNDSRSNGSSNNMIAYCFAEKQGYSKFGKYVGNGSGTSDGTFNGPMVYTGFKPAWVMVKASSASSGDGWNIFDNKRGPINYNQNKLYADSSGAESGSVYDAVDFLSNGFKIRTGRGGANTSGRTYIYMAFAENPFTTSTGIPTTAR